MVDSAHFFVYSRIRSVCNSFPQKQISAYRFQYTVSGIRAGTEHGWHLTEWLDRNEVSSRRAVLRSFIFAVFWRLDNRHLLFARLRIKSGFFSGRTGRTGCPTIKKQQRHRRTARRNLLSFLSKPLCPMPPVFCACPNPGNCVLETVG